MEQVWVCWFIISFSVPQGPPKRLQIHLQAHLIVFYGNRAYDDTFVELQDVLTGAGFVCIAAVAATAEHSIMRQFATGRSDAQDEKEHIVFG